MYNPRQDEQNSRQNRRSHRSWALRLAVGAVAVAAFVPGPESASAIGQAQDSGEERRYEIVYSERPVSNFFTSPADFTQVSADVTPVPKPKVPTPRIIVVTQTASRTPTPSKTPVPTETPYVLATQFTALSRDYETTRSNAANAQKRLDEIQPVIDDYLRNRWIFDYVRDTQEKGLLTTMVTRHPFLTTLAVVLGVGAVTGAVIAGRGVYRNSGEVVRMIRRRPRPAVPGDAVPGGGDPAHH